MRQSEYTRSHSSAIRAVKIPKRSGSADIPTLEVPLILSTTPTQPIHVHSFIDARHRGGRRRRRRRIRHRSYREWSRISSLSGDRIGEHCTTFPAMSSPFRLRVMVPELHQHEFAFQVICVSGLPSLVTCFSFWEPLFNRPTRQSCVRMKSFLAGGVQPSSIFVTKVVF